MKTIFGKVVVKLRERPVNRLFSNGLIELAREATGPSMSSEENRVSEAGQKVIERASKERRRFRRVNVNITGRLYIPATEEEAICTVQDISPGDVALRCDLKEDRSSVPPAAVS
jgi:hypothetical protein